MGKADFLIEDMHTGEVIPVEVKSGKYSTRHAALDALITVKNYAISHAVVLHMRNVSSEGASATCRSIWQGFSR